MPTWKHSMKSCVMNKNLRKEHNQNLLQRKKGLSITKCFKHIIPLDNSHIPLEIRDQESDGNVLLEFSDGTFLFFAGITEDGGWLKIENNLDVYNNDRSMFTNISTNDFWQSILNLEIVDIIELEYDNNWQLNTYCVRFTLANKNAFEISYQSETAYDSDTTIIRPYPTLIGSFQ